MKQTAKIIPLLFGVLFLISLGISIYTILSLSQVSRGQSVDYTTAESHYGIFLPDNSYTFFQDVIEGAKAAGEELDCGLSFHSIGNGTPDFMMAKYSGIDGAIVYPNIPESEARAILSELSEHDIPVVLIEHGIADESPWPFVGTNNFDLGKKIGELIAKTGKDVVQLAIVYSDKSPGIFAEKELVEMGIRSALGTRLSQPINVLKTDLNPLDVEDLIYQILRNQPAINTIVFTDTNDTLAATQVVIDMNLVGAVQIIGFGVDEPILEYIQSGILSGTVAVNPFEIGYHAVQVLQELQHEGISESYIDTGVEIVTQQNLSEIRAKRSSSGGGVQ